MWLSQDLLTPVAESITQTHEFQQAMEGKSCPKLQIRIQVKNCENQENSYIAEP